MMQASLSNPGSFSAVTPSDTSRISCRAIYVGGGGNLALSVDGTTTAVTLVGVPTGAIIPIELNQGRIMSTNTTATSIVALA